MLKFYVILVELKRDQLAYSFKKANLVQKTCFDFKTNISRTFGTVIYTATKALS